MSDRDIRDWKWLTDVGSGERRLEGCAWVVVIFKVIQRRYYSRCVGICFSIRLKEVKSQKRLKDVFLKSKQQFNKDVGIRKRALPQCLSLFINLPVPIESANRD